MKEVFYHQLTHVAQYATLVSSWYNTFVNAELSEIGYTSFNDPAAEPYGRGTDPTYSPIIALGESWAYHIGHYLTDERYHNQSSDWYDAGQQAHYYNGSPTAGLSSHLNLLENFNPNSATDHFKWIPTGLFYDLFDPANEIRPITGPVTDAVSGFTNAQMFNAFQSSIYTLGDYRLKLIQQNPNNPTINQVTNLFTEYHN